MAFLPTPSAALRYWNMARQRYCCRLARYRNTLRVSADPVAKPAAHTRAESRVSRPSKTTAGERQTVCWREMDSNHRYRIKKQPFLAALARSRNSPSARKAASFVPGPIVRIHLPPAKSLVRTDLEGAESSGL